MVIFVKSCFLWLLLLLLLLLPPPYSTADGHRVSQQVSPSPVRLRILDNHVEIENGIVKLSLLKHCGLVSSIGFKGIDNVLEYRNKETRRGYWDIVWSFPEKGNHKFDTFESASLRVVANSKDQVEVSFTSTWNISLPQYTLPLNVDRRFVVLGGVSGFYSYAIFEHLEGWPDLNIDEARIAFKLDKNLFDYMAISDSIQKIMPTDYDRRSGQQLNFPEAVRLTNPGNPNLSGEVDDKYQYSLENKDNRVQGWISSDKHVGFWMITPSDEFRAGGPVKQDLTSHTGPTCLNVFFSGHYAGSEFGIRLRGGEAWKKVFGPVFIYLNSDSTNNASTSLLWNDAKTQMLEESRKWPYDFPLSGEFPGAQQRGAIKGRLLVRDRYISQRLLLAKNAYVGLAAPGHIGSWQHQAKGYQFWTQTDEFGYFTIRAIRANTYNLYAWVPGIMGDYKLGIDIIISPGTQVHMGDLIYDPPRNGPTLWEIGIPDRSAAEFFIPDPSPSLANKLYLGGDEKYRQYGLWDRYTDLYPTHDLVYTIGVSDYRKDWFFAHVNRKVRNHSYTPTTWQIKFDLRNVNANGTYTLRLALASANFAEIQVGINKNIDGEAVDFRTGRIGRDNAIARHGIHGLYWLFGVDIAGHQLFNGRNTIYLKQSRSNNGPFINVMYDYIRLEGPPRPYY
ncbi:probable rhamnogalacturonate lyase B [Andrographis paniculata]|uniref:probable rhamnogalacturonate lyase B n=1 Tax=Andrographis paniculata TaxID=175694 RepID=UPI0021E93747|nr:probable rhamnogalacturonate lyase B [Andrographis paniculata]